jgi:hypothetical protein
MVEVDERKIRAILTEQEGDYCHKLPKEKFITSAYGIAHKFNSKAPIFRFYKYIIRDIFNIKKHPSRYGKDEALKIREYVVLNDLKNYEWALVWQTIKEKYIKKSLFVFSENEFLSYAIFAINYNSGKGVKVLQRLLNRYGANLKVDNFAGSYTLRALEKYSDKVTKHDIREECEKFYNELNRDNYHRSHLRICDLISR